MESALGKDFPEKVTLSQVLTISELTKKIIFQAKGNPCAGRELTGYRTGKEACLLGR